MHATTRPGRDCPLSYRYGAQALAVPASLATETLWVAGGLYGNCEALERLLEMFAAEPGEKLLVFNGDFHWFDVARADFLRISSAVLRHHATRGNVETELASPGEDAGCGCVYPDWVGDAEVEYSNGIIERLRGTARGEPQALGRLAALPMFLLAEIGGERIAIVHGDAESLAGWEFSQESLASREGISGARAAFETANARVFASSHSCLPVLQSFGEEHAIINNGSAGMPNFRGARYGLATRISVRSHAGALYGARIGRLHLEAMPIEYDHAAWHERFLELWPPGTDAHASYYQRIVNGPGYDRARALRAQPGRAERAT